MLELIDIGIKNVVGYRISGKITDDDMELALSKIKETIILCKGKSI